MIDSMSETERTGPNIHTALLADARRLSSEHYQEQAQPEPPAVIPHTQPVPAPLPVEGTNLVKDIKRFLRPVVGTLYRLAKPVWRPIAFRWRTYLLAPLQAESQRTAQTIHVIQAAQAVQATQDQLQQLAAELHALRVEQAQNAQRQQEELAAVCLQVLQELDTTRDALTRTVISAAPERLDIPFDRLERIEQYTYASARRVAVPGEPGEILVRTSVGYLLCPASDYPLLATLVDVGELELGTRQLIQKLLRPGDTFVDVGANIGMHALAAAIAMKASGRIIAFEPHPVTHGLLRKSILLNGFAGMTETHQAAASNRPGRLPLFLGATSGHHSLYPLEGKTEPTVATIDVPLVRLDDTIGADTHVDLIKIDVEGAELDVLEGAIATIERNPAVALIVEFGFLHLRRTGHSTRDWLRAFEELRFEFRVIEPTTGALLEWTSAQLESVDSINLLFARAESKAWERARSHA